MSSFSRSKGQRGERAVAAIIHELTGWQVQRRVRNDKHDSDLVGVPGWSIEVKDHARVTLGDVQEWWKQSVRQAAGEIPLLVYKRQRGSWRFVWPLAVHLTFQQSEFWKDYEWTVEGTADAWAAVARELCGTN